MLVHRITYLDSKIKDYVKMKRIYFQIKQQTRSETKLYSLISPVHPTKSQDD